MSNKMHTTSEMGAPLKENKIVTLIPNFSFYGQFAAVFFSFYFFRLIVLWQIKMFYLF